MDSFVNFLSKFFLVVAKKRTYLNLLYLLLAFPLGLFYFVFLTTGLSLGFGLAIIWVGVVILAGMFAAWYGLAAFERQTAIHLLGEEIPPMNHQDLSGKSLWGKFSATFTNPVTWKGLVFLIVKLPMGIVSFTALVTCAATSVALLATPFYYRYVYPFIDITIEGAVWKPIWVIDSFSEVMLACLAGGLLVFASLHILNGLAWISGKFARVMLGNFSTASTPVPTASVPAKIQTPAQVENSTAS